MDEVGEDPIKITRKDIGKNEDDSDSGAVEDRVRVVGESFPDPKKPGLIARLYSLLATKRVARRIKLPPEKKGATDREILAAIRLSPPETEELLPIIRELKPGEDEDEENRLAAVYVSAEINQSSANIFAKNLRVNTPKIIQNPDRKSYTSGEWYTFADLNELANRWHLPIMVIRKDGNHWILALQEPERTDNGWRVLVYDPRENLESWQPLDDWDSELQNPEKLVEHGIFMNELAYEALRDGNYNYSLDGDRKLADRAEIYLAKQVRTQFNAEDCGPLVLFAAALRQAVNPNWDEFKFAGIKQMEKDTNTRIRTREELFGEENN